MVGLSGNALGLNPDWAQYLRTSLENGKKYMQPKQIKNNIILLEFLSKPSSFIYCQNKPVRSVTTITGLLWCR